VESVNGFGRGFENSSERHYQQDSIKMLSIDEKKRFAQEQLQFLKEQGITGSMRLSRIFKAAGPGQIKEAFKLASQAKSQEEKDLLDCLLWGAGGSQDVGHTRMASVLRRAGFQPPMVKSPNAFFRILDGALEILFPGSYEFTSEELVEIEKGIERSKERAAKYKSQAGNGEEAGTDYLPKNEEDIE
jgi:hypothetical protein